MARQTKTTKKAGGRRAGKGKAMVSAADMKKQLAKMAEDEDDRLGHGGESIYVSTQGKKFTWQDADITGQLADGVIIVEFAPENRWFDRPYDPDVEAAVPACFAVDLVNPDDLVPHEDAPVKQCETCLDCEKNVFGSDARGKGKACANYWRIAILAPDQLDGPILVTRVSPSGYAGFRKYVRGLKKVNKTPPLGVITSLFFDDDMAQPVVQCEFVREVTSAEYGQIIHRREEAQELLMRHGYAVENYEPPRKSGSKKKTAKKKRGRKM